VTLFACCCLVAWQSIDQRLQPGIRCTVQLDPLAYGRPGQLNGKVVSPSTVTERDGTYWGYTVRVASSIKAVFDECPYADKYDLTIGTSERGHESVDDAKFSLRKRRSDPRSASTYRHALIVFGGVAGIEECVDADESLQLAGSASSTMFDRWINICPFQGSRTIRSEEAVLIALARLSPFLAEAACRTPIETNKEAETVKANTADIDEDEVSDESDDN
jgi:methyltransferase